MFSVLALALVNVSNAAVIVGVDNVRDHIIAVDTLNHVTADLGPLGFDWVAGDAAYDALGGRVYLLSAGASRALYAFDLTTLAVTYIGPLGIDNLGAADVDPSSGLIWAIQSNSGDLYSINPANGVATFAVHTGVQADGGYWDEVRHGLVVARIGNNELVLLGGAQNNITSLGIPGGWAGPSDLACDPETMNVWTIRSNGDVTVYSQPRFQVVDSIQLSFGSDAAVFVRDFALPGLPVVSGIGSCPGTIDLTIENGTPGSSVAILSAAGTGRSAIPQGVCAGIPVGLSSPQVLGIVRADGAGVIQRTLNTPPSICGSAFQVIDLQTCQVSNVWTP